MKSFKELCEEVTTGDVAQYSPPMTTTPQHRNPDSKFLNLPCFTLDTKTFTKTCNGILFRKNSNWEKLLPTDISNWIRKTRYKKSFYIHGENTNLFFKVK